MDLHGCKALVLECHTSYCMRLAAATKVEAKTSITGHISF